MRRILFLGFLFAVACSVSSEQTVPGSEPVGTVAAPSDPPVVVVGPSICDRSSKVEINGATYWMPVACNPFYVDKGDPPPTKLLPVLEHHSSP